MKQAKKFIYLLAIIGATAIASSLWWNLSQSKKALVGSARIQARMSFNKDILYRLWNAQQGGVYVPVSEDTPPNPYLSFIPDRDVTTQSGKHLTLVNPAYMTRQVFELGEETFDLRSHITSLKPIRPENKADAWETRALEAFETGKQEVSSLESLGGKPYLRLMKPLVTEKPCLRCHSHQGYKKGDIRGGISVSVPMEPLLAIYRQGRSKVIWIHLFLLVFGAGGLYVGLIRFDKSEKKRQGAVRELEESTYLIREAQEIARLGSYSLDIITGFWTSSEILDEIFGIGPDYERSVEGWVNIIHPEEQEAMLNYFQQEVLGKKQPFDHEYRIIRINDKEERWVHGLGKLEFNDAGEPVRMVGTIQDVTEWRNIQAELAQATKRDKQRLAEIQASLEEARQAQKATMNMMEDLNQEVEQRKKIAEELRVAQEYSQNLIDSSLDMIIAVDNRRRITEFNQAAERTFGYTKEEVIGKHINLLYASANQGRRVHRRTLEAGQHVQEILNQRKNGETFPALLAASTLTDEQGKVMGVMGVSRDITTQKKAQAALETRARQQAAVAALGERALVETDLERLLQYTTEIVAQTLGVEYSKILELQPDGLHLLLKAGVGWKKGYVGKALVSTRKVSHAGYTLLNKGPVIVKDLNRETRFSGPKLLTDHKVVSGLSTLIGRHKDPFGVLGAYTTQLHTFSKEDVDFFTSIAHILGETIGRQQASRALREREEEFRTLITTAQDAIVGLDEKGCISVWNRAATRMFGFTEQEALNQDLHDLIVPRRYRKQAHQGIQKFWKTGKGAIIGRVIELTGLRKDGTEFPMELSVSKYRKGKYLYATGIIRDVSERQRVEQEREILQRLSLRLTEPLNLPMVGEVVAQETRKLFQYDAFALEAIDEDKGLLIGVYNEDTPEGGVAPQHVPATSTPLDKIKNRTPLAGKAQLINRKTLPRMTETNLFGFKQRRSWSLVYAPILWESKPVGILSVQSYTPNRYTKADLALLQTLANQLGGVFARMKESVALRESEERFRGLVNTAPIGIAIHQEGKFILVNDFFLNMMGYKRNEIIGKLALEIIVPEQRKQVAERIAKMIRTGEPAPASEEQFITKDGRIIYAIVAAIPITYQGKPAVEASAIDITGVRQTQQALQESEQKFRTLFEDSRDVIYITTSEGKVLDINNAGVKLFGYPREELLNMSVQKLYLNPRDRKRFQKAIARTGYVEDFSVQLKRADGTILDCLIAASEWRNEAGELRGYQGIIRDITEWNQARKALEEALERAQEGERIKSLFLANVSHEIRTPLNAIIGFTDLIAQNVKHLIDPEQQSFFEAVHQSGQRLLRTVHEILEISQAEAGTTRIQPQILDLGKLVAQVVKELEVQAQEKRLAIKVTKPLKAAYVHVDEYCITQAISNLVENAIKYTDEGFVEISLTSIDKRHCLTIKDTGIGMSKEYMKRMFEVFTQESEGYTKRYQGIGLGLAITKQYLDLNGVQVEVDSQPGKGTKFTLWFKEAPPLKRKARPETEVITKERELALPKSDQKPHILVVEDDVNSQKLLQFYLQAGYEIYFAISVTSAREVLKSKPVDLVLVDLSLVGDEDGLDLVRWMRKTKTWRNIPAIAATAHAYESDRQKCLAAGCADYIAKPLKRDDLLKAIQTLLASS